MSLERFNQAEVAQLAAQGSEIAARQDIREHVQFGNNFYLLFQGVRLAAQAEAGQLTRRELESKVAFNMYLKRAQGYGQAWTAFTDQNGELLTEISAALDDVDIYKDLRDHHRDLLRERKWDEEEVFSKSIHPELGGEAVGIVVWDRLNPLLDSAADAMRVAGIDPEEFYG